MTTKAVFAPDDEVSFLYREKHRCRGIVLSSHAQGYVILKCTSGYAEGRTLAVNFPALTKTAPEPASANLASPRQSDIFAAGTWPDGWDGDEPIATTPLDKVFADGAVQPLLFV
ncbi:hypothetical protein CF341_18720 [Pseudomonas aeruginosa]|nr:hypothetical protein [Pseudomonas aeruginosa]OXT88040.1 hypothetical protein CF341_18720 [Pseudomonas aeruginosa]